MNAPPPKPHRRRLQLSLRMLLALIALIAGWLGYGLFRVQQRARAIQALEKAGAELSLRSPGWRFGRDAWWLAVPWTGVDRRRIYRVSLSEPSMDAFSLLLHFPEIEVLTLQGNARALSKGESSVLKGLTKLRDFGVFSARVSASTIQNLADAPNLSDLQLYACTVNDEVAEALGDLAQVKRMELVYTDIPAPAAARLRQRLPGVKLRIAPDP